MGLIIQQPALQAAGGLRQVLPDRVKKGRQLSHHLSCSVVNVRLFHQRLLGFGLGLTPVRSDPKPRTSDDK